MFWNLNLLNIPYQVNRKVLQTPTKENETQEFSMRFLKLNNSFEAGELKIN